MTARAISAVLPLKVYGRRNINDLARCRILFTSLSTFAPPDFFKDFFIVVPARERRYADALRDEWNSLPIVVVTEEDLVPEMRAYPQVGGWYRQQVVKLHAANAVKTEFYITFDADVILCKPIRPQDAVRDGKALLQPENRMAHPDWWAGSAKLLGLPVELSSPGMTVTPAIFSRTICRRLFEHLEERYRGASAAVLLRRVQDEWTENSLYYRIAERYLMLDAYHFRPIPSTNVCLNCPSSVWRQSHFDTWDMEACFDPKIPGFFTVVQSKTGIPPAVICRRLGTRLPDLQGCPRRAKGKGYPFHHKVQAL